jgi:lysine-N-methylase
MSEKMGLRSGRVLSLHQYVMVIEAWAESLRRGSHVASSLTEIFDLTETLDQGLPPSKKPSDQEIAGALAKIDRPQGLEQSPGKLTFSGRVLLAHLLGGICYPSRVMLAQRMTPIRFWERVGSWGNRSRWLFGWGRVKLLFVKDWVRISQITKVTPFLEGAMGRIVGDYLIELIGRRQGMAKQTYLHRMIVDYALMTVVISRHARAAASAEGLAQVMEKHVREAIGVAELLFSHGDPGQSLVLQQLRLRLMSNREDFRRLLAAES